MAADRRPYYDPGELAAETKQKIKNTRANNESIDYLTIVSDGEPTLDANLGQLIDQIQPLGIKTAVITNATLLGRPDVRQELCRADWVSVKVDALDETLWRKTDRPHKNVRLDIILDGIRSFSMEFKGRFTTETMLVKGLNDGAAHLEQIAEFIGSLNNPTAYLSIPTRPPAVKWVCAPAEETINRAFQIFRSHGIETEYLIGYEGNQFAYTGNIEADILSITAVHPMKEDAIRAYLKKAGGHFSSVEKLIAKKKLLVSEYNDEKFYIRAIKSA